MKKIEAIFRTTKLESVKAALVAQEIAGMTITEVQGHGSQPGERMTYSGNDSILEFVPRVKLEAVVSDESADSVTDTIFQIAHTGAVGDGRIFISDVESVVRIRTGEVSGSADEPSNEHHGTPAGRDGAGRVGSRPLASAMSVQY